MPVGLGRYGWSKRAIKTGFGDAAMDSGYPVGSEVAGINCSRLTMGQTVLLLYTIGSGAVLRGGFRRPRVI